MKLLHLTFREEFSDAVERILNRHGIGDFIRYSGVQGRDRDGRHYGTKVHPGNSTVIQALVEDTHVQDVWSDLGAFRRERDTHAHLRAALLAVEDHL